MYHGPPGVLVCFALQRFSFSFQIICFFFENLFFVMKLHDMFVYSEPGNKSQM